MQPDKVYIDVLSCISLSFCTLLTSQGTYVENIVADEGGDRGPISKRHNILFRTTLKEF
jgi:hypothetical protein